MSKKRQVKYLRQGDKIPKKYSNYTYTGGFLVDPAGNKVVKNPKAAGTPKVIPINAQAIYVGLHHAVRSKIVEHLHTCFSTAFKAQLPAQIVLGGNKILIHLHFYDLLAKLPDLDNLANLFVKTGIDCLTTANNPNQVKASGYTHKLGILPDDKVVFIPYIVVEFSEVTDPKDRKLCFNLYEVDPKFKIENLLDYELSLQQIP